MVYRGETMFYSIDRFFNKIDIQAANCVLFIGFFGILSSHTLFGVGLNADGSNNLGHMILYDSFHFLQETRKIFHIFYQFPAWIFIKLSPVKSIDFLVKVFSFGLLWIHLISLIGCWFILPKDKKRFIFFPLFGFFSGPVLALDISISVALSVCSWVWLTVFVIYYSDLSKTAHKILFFIVPLPLLFSHEMMSYAAWPLIGLCLYKYKKMKKTVFFQKALIWTVAVWLFMVSSVQIFLLFFPMGVLKSIPNRSHDFIDAILSLKFVYLDSYFNFHVIISIIILTLGFLHIFLMGKSVYNRSMITGIFILFYVLCLAFWDFSIRDLFRDSYPVRVWPPVIALPMSGLLWMIFEMGNKDKKQAGRGGFFMAVIVFCLSSVVFRVESDIMSYKNKRMFSESLSECMGVVHQIKTETELYQAYWKSFWDSILFHKTGKITAVLKRDFEICMKVCHGNNYDCVMRCKHQKEHESLLTVKKLHDTGFFDMTELIKNIENKISQCNS